MGEHRIGTGTVFSTASRLRGTQNWNWDSVVIAATRLRGNSEESFSDSMVGQEIFFSKMSTGSRAHTNSYSTGGQGVEA